MDRPRHGYDIAAEMRPGGPIGTTWRLSRQLVYRALERLDALGLAEPRRTEPSGAGPPRTVYGPTRRGRTELRKWLTMPVEHLRDVRSALLLKLVLIERLGADRTELVRAQRATFAPLLDELGSAQRDDVVTLWRHHSAAAVATFLDAISERDAHGTAGAEGRQS